MLLMLDSADEAQIRYWWGQGVLDGVTTNPSVVRRDVAGNAIDAITKLAAMIAPGALHAEVSAAAGPVLVAEAIELSRIAANLVVKVPVLTPEGKPLLREISELVRTGVSVNCTACLSLPQVMLAAKAGAQHISVLVGRIDDESGHGAEVVAAARSWVDDWKMPTRLIAASVRGPGDVIRCMRAGAHGITVSPAVMTKLVDHKYARVTVQQFLDDAVRSGS
ncbi:transaldolase family protein [Phytohabitans sp. LJ34]|uniref:transaldolase family protein n=1 Tax=Phytohabitans sp. LJ34 TaxID=3452217 RepID=UPI003F8C7D24